MSGLVQTIIWDSNKMDENCSFASYWRDNLVALNQRISTAKMEMAGSRLVFSLIEPTDPCRTA